MPAIAASAPNIFNDRQEQDLGDALAESVESSMRIAAPGADDQLTRIGERLLATLPPSGVHYRFRVYDSGEVNGFSLAGGRVYISRKLVASVQSEDALAGVLAHEIGHLATHQTAIEMTYLFRVRMGVTSVGDRADVFAKVHQFLDTPAKDYEVEEQEEKEQLVADRVALFALVGAGYAPESFASFMNESMMNRGKTGNWFSDVFGMTREASKRYRESLKLIGELPQGCKGRQATVSEGFLKWKRNLVEERVQLSAHGAEGDQPLKLNPPLRPSPWRIRFSPDGKYVLVQDEGSITVVQLEPDKVVFRIDAPEVKGAEFTPDSQNLVFSDRNLRVERWSVATGKRLEVKELVVYDGCNQSMLTPDGKTLVCLKAELEGDPRIDLRLIDVDSGKSYYENSKFVAMGAFSSLYDMLSLDLAAITGKSLGGIYVSPGGRYLLVAAADRALAYDLEHRQPVSLGGKLKYLGDARMAFVGPDRIYVVDADVSNGLHKAHLLSFPEGAEVKESQIGDQWVRGGTKGQYVIAGPLKDYAAGIVDVETGKIVAASNVEAMDTWENHIADESPNGGLALGTLGSKGERVISFPLGPLPKPRAAGFSPDGKYLVLSLRSRSALWDLETGKQLHLMRPVDDLWIDDQDELFGQFPKFLTQEGGEFEIPLSHPAIKRLAPYDGKSWEFENLEYTLKPMGNKKDTGRHVALEVKNMDTQAVLWTHDFPKERPACWAADDNRLVLGWDLSSEAAQVELKKSEKLQREAGTLKSRKKGLLIETVAPQTGALLEQVVLPEVDLTRGWNDERIARVSGDVVLVRGEHGNTSIYRLDSGAKVGEFFGDVVASDAGLDLIAAVNREDEVLLVSEHSGKERERFTLGSPVRLARILGKDKMLLVLTADQVVHRIPLGGVQ